LSAPSKQFEADVGNLAHQAAGIHSGFADRAPCLFQPFSSGKKIDRANPAASRGMEFRGRHIGRRVIGNR
jgi:hypothetical protein